MEVSNYHPQWLTRAAWPGERNDCTVHAVSAACNATYHDAHVYLEKHGRKPKRGMLFGTFMLQRTDLMGCRVNELVGVKGLTLARVLPRLATGRYIIRKKGHAFAVLDGKVYDRSASGPRSRVLQVWHVTPPVAIQQVTLPPVPPSVPRFVQPTQKLPWAIERYFELLSAGKADQAVRLFNHTSASIQAAILAEKTRRNL